MDRAQQILRSLPRDARIVEIAPGPAPVAPRHAGWDTAVVDRPPPAGADGGIEAVDHPWVTGTPPDAVPPDRHGTFDAVIAGRIVEETPDLVAFLRGAGRLLAPGGVVLLALQDKRAGPAFYRHPSTTADAVAAHAEGHDRPTLRTRIDHALARTLPPDPDGAGGADLPPAAPACAPLDATAWPGGADSPSDAGIANWIFTPASFALIVLELGLLGHLDLHVAEVRDLPGTEFLAWLRGGRPDLGPDAARRRRQDLMERVVVELAEPSRRVAGSPMSRLSPESLVRRQLAQAVGHIEALRLTLTAVRASLRPRGLDRRGFRDLIARASRAAPNSGPGAIQHSVLRDEATRILDLHRDRAVDRHGEAPAEPALADAVLTVPLAAAQFADPLLVVEIERERERGRAVRTVLAAVLASVPRWALNRRRFRAMIAEAGRATPDTGPASVRHGVLFEEARRILDKR